MIRCLLAALLAPLLHGCPSATVHSAMQAAVERCASTRTVAYTEGAWSSKFDLACYSTSETPR